MYSRRKWRDDRSWRLAAADSEASARISSQLPCSPVVADLLVRRGIDSPDAAARFLDPRLSHLEEPDLMPGIGLAVERIARGVAGREPIAIFGDYDVDGVVSTVLLLEFFSFLGVPARHYLPRRVEEGYGLNGNAVRRFAREGVRLIITVDNGSSARDEVELARELGIDVVIIDHHLPSDPPPRPHAFVNPWLEGSRYRFPRLAGVGVAFKVIWAMCQHFSRSRKVSPEFREFLMEALGLAALGTISDVVPLVGENRVLAHRGLQALETSKLPGIRALVRRALEAKAPPGSSSARAAGRLESRDVAFRIGPCLNAAGRLGEADLALRLLIGRDPGETEILLDRLERDNLRRREIENEIHRQALDGLSGGWDARRERVLVLAREGWHPGVIGIVAARLVEEFYRPTLLIAIQDGSGKGSARSIPQVSIARALEEARGCLESFGGHDRAAGIRIAPDRIDELRDTLNRVIQVHPEQMRPELEIDGEYDLSGWTPRLLRELEGLAPHGEGNREPLFALRGVRIAGAPRLVGRSGSHLSFMVRQGTSVLKAIAFGMGERCAELSAAPAGISIAYEPILNRWGNRENVELRVRELAFPAAGPAWK